MSAHEQPRLLHAVLPDRSGQGAGLTEAEDMQDPELEKAVNDSGFPLQLGLKHLVQTGGARFRVALAEHRWRDPLADETKFLDLALRTGDDRLPQLLVVECKRARDTDWIFLREPTGQAPN